MDKVPSKRGRLFTYVAALGFVLLFVSLATNLDSYLLGSIYSGQRELMQLTGGKLSDPSPVDVDDTEPKPVKEDEEPDTLNSELAESSKPQTANDSPPMVSEAPETEDPLPEPTTNEIRTAPVRPKRPASVHTSEVPQTRRTYQPPRINYGQYSPPQQSNQNTKPVPKPSAPKQLAPKPPAAQPAPVTPAPAPTPAPLPEPAPLPDPQEQQEPPKENEGSDNGNNDNTLPPVSIE